MMQSCHRIPTLTLWNLLESESLIKVPLLPPAARAVDSPCRRTKSNERLSPGRHLHLQNRGKNVQQIVHNAAIHKPGRLNGRRKSRISSAWHDGSEEEDDNEEEEEGNSDNEGPASNKPYIPPLNTSSIVSTRPPQNQSQAGNIIAKPNSHQGLCDPCTLPQLPPSWPHSMSGTLYGLMVVLTPDKDQP